MLFQVSSYISKWYKIWLSKELSNDFQKNLKKTTQIKKEPVATQLKLNMNSQIEETQLKEYLLGELDEQRQATVEDNLFVDQEMFQRLEIVENELVDDYVRKNLSSADRKRFESYFLINPEHQQKLRISQTIDKYVSNNRKVVIKTVPFSLRELFVSFFSFRSLIAATATIIIVVLLTSVISVLNENARLKKELAELRSIEGNSSKELAQAKARSQELTQAIEDQNRLRRELEDKLAEVPKEKTPKPQIKEEEKTETQPNFIAFLLTSGTLRDDEGATELKIPSKIKEIRLTLVLEVSGYMGYQAQIQDQNGNALLNQYKLKENKTKKTVLVKLQAKLLEKGKYRIVLQGLTAKLNPVKIGTYYFNLVK